MKGHLKKYLMILAAASLAVAMAVPANAAFKYKKISLTAGVGGAIPVRSRLFVDETNRLAFYRFVAAEYSISDRLSLGGQYAGTDFKFQEGGKVKAITWGPYAIAYFDMIPQNHWMVFLKMGVSKSDVESPESFSKPEWQALGGIGVEFYAYGNARGRIGVDFHDIVGDEIGAFFTYVALNFDPFNF